MITTVTKEKNIITFTTDEGKKILLDINTGYMYGTSGKVLKRLNSEVGQYLRNSIVARNCPLGILRVFTDSYWTYTELYENGLKKEYLNCLQMLDKFNSIGYTFPCTKSVNMLKVAEFNKYFAKFSRAFKENNELHFFEYIKTVEREEFFEKVNLNNDNPYMTEGISEYIYNHFKNYSAKQIKIIAHMLTYGGLYDAFFRTENVLGSYKLHSFLQHYINLCEDLDVEVNKDNPVKHYGYVLKLYHAKKDELLNKQIEKFQSLKKDILFFEDDEFTIIIPTTSEEFKNEGINNRNCVGSYAEQVANKRTHVVFVRRKNDINKSLVTCEVSTLGNIRQFNGFGNSYISSANPSLVEFKKKYQKHLLENWEN